MNDALREPRDQAGESAPTDSGRRREGRGAAQSPHRVRIVYAASRLILGGAERIVVSLRGPGRSQLLTTVLFILLLTLSPGRWTETEGRQGQDSRIADIVLNIALFAPLGAALGHGGRSALGSLVAGTLLSGGIEIVQLGVPGRMASLEDILFNAVGTIVGWTLWRTAPVWVRPDARAAGWLALAAASVAATVLGATGLLLQPSFPPTRYFGGWTHEFGHLFVYRGRVIEASVGEEGIPSGPIPHSRELRSRLAAGETLRVRALAGPPVTGLAPLLSIHDELQREVLLLGPDREDLVYRFRTRAAAMGFDSPELRVSGVLRGIRAGEPLRVAVWPDRRGACIDVNGTVRCGMGFTLGTGWTLLLYGQGFPPWTHEFLNVLWMASLGIPVGYWGGTRLQGGVSVTLFAAALLLIPPATGFVQTPTGELGAALAGLLGGAWLQLRMTRWSPAGASARAGASISEGPGSPTPRVSSAAVLATESALRIHRGDGRAAAPLSPE